MATPGKTGKGKSKQDKKKPGGGDGGGGGAPGTIPPMVPPKIPAPESKDEDLEIDLNFGDLDIWDIEARTYAEIEDTIKALKGKPNAERNIPVLIKYSVGSGGIGISERRLQKIKNPVSRQAVRTAISELGVSGGAQGGGGLRPDTITMNRVLAAFIVEVQEAAALVADVKDFKTVAAVPPGITSWACVNGTIQMIPPTADYTILAQLILYYHFQTSLQLALSPRLRGKMDANRIAKTMFGIKKSWGKQYDPAEFDPSSVSHLWVDVASQSESYQKGFAEAKAQASKLWDSIVVTGEGAPVASSAEFKALADQVMAALSNRGR